MGFSFLKKLFGNSAEEKVLTESPEAVDNAVASEAVDTDSAEQPEANPADSKGHGRNRRHHQRRQEMGNARTEDGGEMDPSASIEQLQEFVRYVAAALVDNPEALSLDVVEKDRLTVIRVRCEKSDIGKIVGKSGKTISAVRALVSGVSGRYGQRVTVDVLD